MSVSPEDATSTAEGQPKSSRSSLSSSSNGPQLSTAKTGTSEDKPNAPSEKTISCVSCRKRKLKCDRLKPKCGTCSRLRHECDYPERKRNLGSKRRNMKELEARLAQVETQLISETKGGATIQTSAVQTTEPDWNNYTMDMNMDITMDIGSGVLLDESFDIPLSAFDFQSAAPSLPEGNFFSQDLISLGLQESLPPNQMVDDLHEIYFDKFHPTLPMMHKGRYLASLNLPPHMQPPICLRYALWATAASISEKYMQYEELLYERARKYVEAAEMKGHGEAFVTVQYAQTWSLIATYEAKKTYFTRAWMSTGRTTRLCQMLGLQRLDGQTRDVKRFLPPAKDWIELEERRRTFWAAFYGDRWASSGTGWPMVIEENEIETNLPCSEGSFETGVTEENIALKEAFTPEGASRISPFGGVVISACLFGHNFQHLHKTGKDEHPEDLANGEFWKRHRQMDNVLSNTFMFLPDNLRLPGGLRDMNVVFLHMNIHASTICLHQAAVLTAEKNNISKIFIRQSRARSLMAAEEIANIMKLVSHLDASNMNSWVGFCLYVASGVFIQDEKSKDRHPQSIPNLEFLLAAMKAIGNRHSITKHFTAQLELDIVGAGITPNIPLIGILASRGGQPMTSEEIRSLTDPTTRTGSDAPLPVDGPCPYMSGMAKGSMTASASFTNDKSPHFFGIVSSGSSEIPKAGLPPFGISPQESSSAKGDDPTPGYGMFPGKGVYPDPKFNHPPEGIHDHVHPSLPNWNAPSNTALDGSKNSYQFNKHVSLDSNNFASSNPVPTNPSPPAGGSPFDIDSFLAGNTPSSDSSGSNAMQFPYRQADSSNHNKSPDYSMFQANPNSFVMAVDWSIDIPFNAESQNELYGIPGDLQHKPSDSASDLMRAQSWSQNPEPTDGVRRSKGQSEG